MSRAMAVEEWRRFLSAGTRTAKIACVLRDGTPHVTPVWFLLDGEQVVFTTPVDSVKARALRRDPRVSVCVDLEDHPFAFVSITGRAVLDRTPALVNRWADRIRARYDERARATAATGLAAGGGGEPDRRPATVLVRIVPTRVVAISYDA